MSVTMERQSSYRSLLKIPGVFPLVLAVTLSRLAARMFVLTLVLFVLIKFSSPALAGWLTFAAVLPGIIMSPFAGTLLDRVGPTTAVRIDMSGSAVVTAAISFVGWAGWSSPIILFPLLMLYSLTGPLGAGGARTLLPRLVPPHALNRANALDAAVYAVADIVGPAIAGVLVAWFEPETAIASIAAAYAGAAFCISHVQRLPGFSSNQTSFLRQTIEGLQMVARQPTLRGLALSYSLYEITWGTLSVAVPVSVAAHTGSSVAGFLWAAVGIAGAIGAILAGHISTAARERYVMAGGMVITAFAAWPIAAEFGFGGLVFGLMLAGVVSGPVGVALLTLRHRRTDPEQRGRVMSISVSLNIVGFPLGSAIAGMLIPQSLSATFVLAGIASIVAAIATVSIPLEQ